MSDWWMSNRAAGLPVPNKRRTIKQPKPRRIADLAVADGCLGLAKRNAYS
jgi:hypothetical protein